MLRALKLIEAGVKMYYTSHIEAKVAQHYPFLPTSKKKKAYHLFSRFSTNFKFINFFFSVLMKNLVMKQLILNKVFMCIR